MRKALSIALFALAVLAFGGCATTQDADSLSERPWNSPKNWEHGLPAGMMNQRY